MAAPLRTSGIDCPESNREVLETLHVPVTLATWACTSGLERQHVRAAELTALTDPSRTPRPFHCAMEEKGIGDLNDSKLLHDSYS